MSRVEVNAKGIKNRLKSIKPHRAIAEYIWNGFDAGANTIKIDYLATEVGDIYELSISDNGNGMPFKEVHNKFKPVLSSEKRDSEVQHTLVHGKNGLGRLTFHHFAQTAIWKTCYKTGNKFFEYTITADEGNIDQYDPSEENECVNHKTGTIVNFNNIFDLSDYYIKHTLKAFLKKEFEWFL
jgi:DNA topoisomerase VI subunit B